MMQRHKYLLRPDKRRPGEKTFADFLKVRAPIVIPQDTDFRPQMPPIWNQEDLGACPSLAADAIDQFIKGYGNEPSQLFTYYHVRKVEGNPADEDTGGTLSGTIDAIKQYGICNSSIWPYDISKYAETPSPEAYADGLAGNDTLAQAYRVETVDEAREALAAGHLPYIGIRVYENFETEEVMRTGIIPAPAGGLLGGHALVIVGHHDNQASRCIIKRLCKQPASRGYFIIRNSWGDGIGINGSGYFRADYEVLEQLLMDMWIVVK